MIALFLIGLFQFTAGYLFPTFFFLYYEQSQTEKLSVCCIIIAFLKGFSKDVFASKC